MTGAPFLTIGHSTRSLNAFIACLCAHHVRVLADVRSVPRSRHNPQFVEEFLAPAPRSGGDQLLSSFRPGWVSSAVGQLTQWCMAQLLLSRLRGLHADRCVPVALDELIALGRGGTVAVMCAEAVPWRSTAR